MLTGCFHVVVTVHRVKATKQWVTWSMSLVWVLVSSPRAMHTEVGLLDHGEFRSQLLRWRPWGLGNRAVDEDQSHDQQQDQFSELFLCGVQVYLDALCVVCVYVSMPGNTQRQPSGGSARATAWVWGQKNACKPGLPCVYPLPYNKTYLLSLSNIVCTPPIHCWIFNTVSTTLISQF